MPPPPLATPLMGNPFYTHGATRSTHTGATPVHTWDPRFRGQRHDKNHRHLTVSRPLALGAAVRHSAGVDAVHKTLQSDIC